MQIVNIDLIPQKIKPVVNLSQFDNGRVVRFALFENGEEYTLAGTETIEVNIRKPDGNIVVITPTVTASKFVDVSFTEQACACYGKSFGELSIMSGDDVIGTCNFDMEVEISPLQGGVDSATEIDNLRTQIDEIISGEGYVKDTDLDILQSDWEETDPDSPAFIKNKPVNPGQVQANWDETDPDSAAYIQNKPTIPTSTSQLTNDSGFVTASDLATVATTGDYDDLTDKPDLSIYAQSSDLATVATSGSYNDLTDKPTIPAAQIQSDYAQTNSSAVDYIKNKPVLPFEDKGQYLIETTPATKRSIEFTTLIGGTCGVNQLVDTGDTSVNTISGHKYLTRINGVESIIAGGSAVSINDSSEDNVIDLTAYFGTTIADYVYTLESGTAGAGITWLKNNGFFTADYYPYNAGGLLSVKTSKKINRDADNNIIGEYTLDDIELRGILKLDGNNNLYYDGDTYSSSGEVVRKYGIVDLGTLTWQVHPQDNTVYYALMSSDLIKKQTVDMISALYLAGNPSTPVGSQPDLTIWSDMGADGYVYAKNSNYVNDSVAFTSAMSGVYLVYELATPTTETADQFTNPMIVDGNGTEQFIDGRTVEMPVGHDTFYIPMN